MATKQDWVSPQYISKHYCISLSTVRRIAQGMEEKGMRVYRSRIVRVNLSDLERYMAMKGKERQNKSFLYVRR